MGKRLRSNMDRLSRQGTHGPMLDYRGCKMTDQEAQKLWDACLIKSWRQFFTLYQAYNMFYSIAAKSVHDFDILRKPSPSTPWKVGVRMFVAQRLPKINEKLHKLSPENDIKLLNVLQKTKYTTATQDLNVDNERKNARLKHKNDLAFVDLNTTKYYDRNASTNWSTVK
jgi:hypothetical protein